MVRERRVEVNVKRLVRWFFALVAISACGRSTREVSEHANGTGGSSGSVGRGGSAGAAAGLAPAPLEVEHETEVMRCDGGRVDQEFLIQPSMECRQAPDYDFATNQTWVCKVADYCTTHADCGEEPFGRCMGAPSAECVYPSEPCSADEACTSRPNGSCPDAWPGRQCNEAGKCWSQPRECHYAPVVVAEEDAEEGCKSDADCDGGVCTKRLLYTRCYYHGCIADSDCGAGMRCACSNGMNACVPADCASDADCPEGECRLDYGCFAAQGFRCSSPADTCEEDDECSMSGRCEYSAGRFQCQRDLCPID